MIRCALVEILMPGGGYALTGNLKWAAAVVVSLLLVFAACLFVPWPFWLIIPMRLGAIVDAARRGRKGPPIEGWWWKPMLLVGAVGLGMTMVVRLYAIEAFGIPSVSMAPTLMLDDKITVDKLSLHWRPPERGEVVAFWMGPRTWVKRVIGVGGDRIAVRGGVLYVNGESVVRRPLGPTTYRNRDEMSGRMSTEHAFAYEERFAGRTYHVYGEPPDQEPPYVHDYPDETRGADACGRMPLDGDRGAVPMVPGTDGTCIVPPGALFFMGDNRVNSNDSRMWGAMPADRVFGRVVGIWLGGESHRLARIGNVE
jgi:signal peptidase I